MNTSEFYNQLIGLEEKLLRYAYHFTANKEDARDLVQETYLRALLYRRQFQESTNLQAWTYEIMKNTYFNNYRKISRQRTIFDNTADLFFFNQNKDTFNTSPDSALRVKEINSAIQRLGNPNRTLVEMYLEGYKYKEMSQSLTVNIGTIKSRLHTSREKLSKLLDEEI